MSAAQTARAANPNMSGRELAQALRAQRSRNGKTGEKKAEPTGRMRPPKPTPAAGAQETPPPDEARSDRLSDGARRRAGSPEPVLRIPAEIPREVEDTAHGVAPGAALTP